MSKTGHDTKTLFVGRTANGNDEIDISGFGRDNFVSIVQGTFGSGTVDLEVEVAAGVWVPVFDDDKVAMTGIDADESRPFTAVGLALRHVLSNQAGTTLSSWITH